MVATATDGLTVYKPRVVGVRDWDPYATGLWTLHREISSSTQLIDVEATLRAQAQAIARGGPPGCESAGRICHARVFVPPAGATGAALLDTLASQPSEFQWAARYWLEWVHPQQGPHNVDRLSHDSVPPGDHRDWWWRRHELWAIYLAIYAYMLQNFSAHLAWLVSVWPGINWLPPEIAIPAVAYELVQRSTTYYSRFGSKLRELAEAKGQLARLKEIGSLAAAYPMNLTFFLPPPRALETLARRLFGLFLFVESVTPYPMFAPREISRRLYPLQQREMDYQWRTAYARMRLLANEVSPHGSVIEGLCTVFTEELLRGTRRQLVLDEIMCGTMCGAYLTPQRIAERGWVMANDRARVEWIDGPLFALVANLDLWREWISGPISREDNLQFADHIARAVPYALDTLCAYDRSMTLTFQQKMSYLPTAVGEFSCDDSISSGVNVVHFLNELPVMLVKCRLFGDVCAAMRRRMHIALGVCARDVFDFEK